MTTAETVKFEIQREGRRVNRAEAERGEGVRSIRDFLVLVRGSWFSYENYRVAIRGRVYLRVAACAAASAHGKWSGGCKDA